MNTTTTIRVSYIHLQGYRVSRNFDTVALAQEFMDVNAMVHPLPGAKLMIGSVAWVQDGNSYATEDGQHRAEPIHWEDAPTTWLLMTADGMGGWDDVQDFPTVDEAMAEVL